MNDSDICQCSCHENPGRIHIAPCCASCPACGARIANRHRDRHRMMCPMRAALAPLDRRDAALRLLRAGRGLRQALELIGNTEACIDFYARDLGPPNRLATEGWRVARYLTEIARDLDPEALLDADLAGPVDPAWEQLLNVAEGLLAAFEYDGGRLVGAVYDTRNELRRRVALVRGRTPCPQCGRVLPDDGRCDCRAGAPQPEE